MQSPGLVGAERRHMRGVSAMVVSDAPDSLDSWQSPVLQSVAPVMEQASLVTLSRDNISQVAQWMAYEGFPPLGSAALFDFGPDPDTTIDFTLVLNTLNFAFTDFDSGLIFTTNYQGKTWSDSEALVACIHRAITAGVPLFSGDYLARVTRRDLEELFSGSCEMPMLEDRVELLNEVGETLVDKYQGSFARFLRSCSPRLYAEGDGVLERLVMEFPRFNDVSDYRGGEVKFFKLAQLALWSIHLALAPQKHWALEDAHLVTGFADYIVPVALRVMGILEYDPELEHHINSRVMVPQNSEPEVELRAASLMGIALLTNELNQRRQGLAPLLQPQVDYRLWKTYHTTHWPHHLTKTRMY